MGLQGATVLQKQLAEKRWRTNKQKMLKMAALCSKTSGYFLRLLSGGFWSFILKFGSDSLCRFCVRLPPSSICSVLLVAHWSWHPSKLQQRGILNGAEQRDTSETPHSATQTAISFTGHNAAGKHVRNKRVIICRRLTLCESSNWTRSATLVQPKETPGWTLPE